MLLELLTLVASRNTTLRFFDSYGSSRKSLGILMSNNKQRNDMQKGVYFASMTYRLRTNSLPFSGISTYGNVLQ